jgi:hypothetical protein
MQHTNNIGIECASCGLTSGRYTDSGEVRCGDCGRYAETSDVYCGKHKVDKRRTPNGGACPMCRMEYKRDSRLAERQERLADPNMHNLVDAPANSILHRR